MDIQYHTPCSKNILKQLVFQNLTAYDKEIEIVMKLTYLTYVYFPYNILPLQVILLVI